MQAQENWTNRDEDNVSPRCENTDEIVYHVINECPSLVLAREGHPDITLDTSPEYLVWSEKKQEWEEI